MLRAASQPIHDILRSFTSCVVDPRAAPAVVWVSRVRDISCPHARWEGRQNLSAPFLCNESRVTIPLPDMSDREQGCFPSRFAICRRKGKSHNGRSARSRWSKGVSLETQCHPVILWHSCWRRMRGKNVLCMYVQDGMGAFCRNVTNQRRPPGNFNLI